MIERQVDVTTPDGEMTTFIFTPSTAAPSRWCCTSWMRRASGPALKDMASRLASAGYYVMLPYLFYRGGPYREFGASDEDMHARRELMETVTPTNIVGDAEALLDVATDDAAAGDGRVGVIGFCMSGGLAVSLARALPDRVGAAASIHGAWLVRDTPDSPHLGLDPVRAELYFAWVEDDPTAPLDTIPVMEQALDDAGVTYAIDRITDAVHGFAPAGERYDRRASELHWERVHALLQRNV